jgi:hypothetical protein
MEETSMNESRSRWVLGAAAILLAVVLSAIAYDVGVSQGAAQVAASASAQAAPAPGTVPPLYYYGWHRPWGWGFFPLFPLLFIFFWIFVFRMFWWGGPRRWHYGRLDHETFDEWHRRAHDQMKN